MSYVLFVDYVNADGEKEHRHWDRSSRMWIETEHNCRGYELSKAAACQVSKLDKVGFLLPKGATVLRFGYNLCPMAI